MSPAARFAAASAALLGLLFPVLETLRRGVSAWLTTPVTLLEDYVAGALLIWAAITVVRGRSAGWIVMLLASAYATGMMSSSFWNQLEAQFQGVAWEANQTVVLVFKAFLWGLPLLLTILAAKTIASSPATSPTSTAPSV